MTDLPASTFLWSDAWILMAIGLASDTGESSLAHVIGAADAVEHAVPTREEVNGALARLGRAGFVDGDPEGRRLSPAGRALLASAAAEGKTLLARLTVLERLLGAAAWKPGTDPCAAGVGEAEHVSAEDYATAVAEYYRMVGYRP
jgi:hypothetical protein